MLGALKALFELPQHSEEDELQQRVNLAAAALLIETARSDFVQDAKEETRVRELLCETLSLDAARVADLFAIAQDSVDEATSLYEFTRTINDHYSAAQKLRLVKAMWYVAYADGDIDKYEEHLIRQVAELTYVPHSDYIQCKLSVGAKTGS